MLRRYGTSARSVRTRRSYDRISNDTAVTESRRSPHPAQEKFRRSVSVGNSDGHRQVRRING
jgi:hypothetical protein